MAIRGCEVVAGVSWPFVVVTLPGREGWIILPLPPSSPSLLPRSSPLHANAGHYSLYRAASPRCGWLMVSCFTLCSPVSSAPSPPQPLPLTVCRTPSAPPAPRSLMQPLMLHSATPAPCSLMQSGLTAGRCHMAVVLEALVESRSAPPEKRICGNTGTRREMVHLARCGLSPRLLWWLGGDGSPA